MSKALTNQVYTTKVYDLEQPRFAHQRQRAHWRAGSAFQL